MTAALDMPPTSAVHALSNNASEPTTMAAVQNMFIAFDSSRAHGSIGFGIECESRLCCLSCLSCNLYLVVRGKLVGSVVVSVIDKFNARTL